MTPFLLLSASVAVLLAAFATTALVAAWLERQTRHDEALRGSRWLAPFAFDTELLFETDNDWQILAHARTGRPPRTRATMLRQANNAAPFVAPHHDLAYLSPDAMQVELTRLF